MDILRRLVMVVSGGVSQAKQFPKQKDEEEEDEGEEEERTEVLSGALPPHTHVLHCTAPLLL